jgi:hypothetical protein
MFTLERMMAGAICGVAALALSAPSYATALVANSGWQIDQIDAANSPSENSDLTFTIAPGKTGIFSLSDGFVAGDVYTVIADSMLIATSTFTVYPTPFVNDLGPAASDFAADCLDPAFSHLQLTFLPGQHSLVVEGDGAGGLPAHVGERLDTLGVPEPAAWLTMLVGFGGLGLSVRRKRARQAFAV